MATEPMVLRRAMPADIPTLNAIAFAAKAHWGYPASAMEQWRAELEVDPDSLARPTCVAEIEGRVAGFVQVDTGADSCDLAMLWVDPSAMGKGVGRALFAWACEVARRAGKARLSIDADPNAEAFYLRQGARRICEVAAPIEGQPERTRPQLVMEVGSPLVDAPSASAYCLAFAVLALLISVVATALAWWAYRPVLPMVGSSWADATYPLTAALSAAALARIAYGAGAHIGTRLSGAFFGATIAFVSLYLTCVHAGAALLIYKGHDRWWAVAWGAGIFSYLIWIFLAFWGFGVVLLGAAIGWRTTRPR